MPATAKGHSLHIGLNHVDPAHYNGWEGRLNACVNDADAMAALAAAAGFAPRKLLDAQATRQAVTDAIRDAARQLAPGDIFLLSCSSHGGSIPNAPGGDVEADGNDETWCLYDGQLVDDELEVLWHEFAPGVRVLLISDSCHSESIARVTPPWLADARSAGRSAATRLMPVGVQFQVYLTHRDFYEPLQVAAKSALDSRGPIGCTVRTLAGCRDGELSYDGPQNGEFTRALLSAWNFGRFRGDYAAFHSAILSRIRTSQNPQHNVIGRADAAFDAQTPFQIANSSPRRARLLRSASDEIDLEVRVSSVQGINRYGFAYAGVPVGMSGGHGSFKAVKNQQGLLEWVMQGSPGGSMKVEVLRGGNVVKAQPSSEIVPPEIEGYDALQILVS